MGNKIEEPKTRKVCGGEAVSRHEICDCMCHSSEYVKHVMPCCTTCPVCKQHIHYMYAKEHKKIHEDTLQMFNTKSENDDDN